ncbi:hypothetical protein E2493_01785 [Sphingomonas parva]|uniref:Uncharacterized protein n=1 Tax=Sphingomonas parva TaxID=2555898 RepID=A0A4Y8ZXN4_9SPHN|nr:hypothetical protein [Sphingomonas parva]TFI60005.1 hypothetical protein E2493_01785 [Sphingomonas parva]
MGHGQDALLLVRAELCDRLAALTRAGSRLGAAEFTARVGAIRTFAAAYGLTPVVRLAQALERAIADSDSSDVRACPTALYLARLQDAIGCETVDDRTSEALIASVSVRLGA